MNKKRFFTLLMICTSMILLAVTAVQAAPAESPPAQDNPKADSECVTCHEEETPGVVTDFQDSKMWEHEDGATCDDCHGDKHNSSDDADKAEMPTPQTCKKCHSDQVEQHEGGKHNLAWAAMDAMPMTHSQPPEISDGQKGCGSCHKIGAKSEEDVAAHGGYGMNECNSCHTRHKFSTAEARRPEACSACHMGFDHPQWEMYSSSKHGTIYQVEGDTWDWDTSLKDGATYRAPTCQYCHMSGGDHNVITSWGFLGLRVEEPDEEWAATRATILKAVGALDAEGNPGALFQGVADLRLARLTMDEWQKPRDEMIEVCTDCHAESYAREQLESGDALLKEADIVFANSIDTIKDLYADGILPEAEVALSPPYPFLLMFYDAPTSIEQDLYLSWMEYRQRAFQGAFHNSADYMHWYGWAPLNETDHRITEEAANMRADAKLAADIEQLTADQATAAEAAPPRSYIDNSQFDFRYNRLGLRRIRSFSIKSVIKNKKSQTFLKSLAFWLFITH